MSPHRRKWEEGDADEGPELTVKGKGTAREWFQGILLAAILVKQFIPGATSQEVAKDSSVRLQPLFSALNEVKSTMEGIKTTVAVIGDHVARLDLEVADHEQRLRSAEQWPRTTGAQPGKP